MKQTTKFKRLNQSNSLNSMVYGKVPPQAPELEEAILGAMILDKDCIEVALDVIKTPNCFYVDCNQKIFAAIAEMHKDGYAIDILTITEYLRKSGELELIGGAYKLMQLTENVVSSAHVEAHSRIMVEKWMSREAIRVCGEIITEAYNDAHDPFELISAGTTQIDQILSSTVKTGIKHIADGVREIMEAEFEQVDSKREFNGIVSGFASLDKLTFGWQNGQLIIIGARPSVGKTAFALSLALNCAKNADKENLHGGPVLVFSLEMGIREITNRLIANIADTDHSHVQNIRLRNSKEEHNIENTRQSLAKLPIFIDDSQSIGLVELRHKSRKFKREKGIGLIIIDYLQLMDAKVEYGMNREQAISAISRGLKGLAKELDIPIIALSQLNRSIENKGNNAVPKLSDLRESGAIEQDANVVMFLSRVNQEKAPVDDILINIEKNRGGLTGDITLRFEKAFQKFSEKAPSFEPFVRPDNPSDGIKKQYPVSSEDNNLFETPF